MHALCRTDAVHVYSGENQFDRSPSTFHMCSNIIYNTSITYWKRQLNFFRPGALTFRLLKSHVFDISTIVFWLTCQCRIVQRIMGFVYVNMYFYLFELCYRAARCKNLYSQTCNRMNENIATSLLPIPYVFIQEFTWMTGIFPSVDLHIRPKIHKTANLCILGVIFSFFWS